MYVFIEKTGSTIGRIEIYGSLAAIIKNEKFENLAINNGPLTPSRLQYRFRNGKTRYEANDFIIVRKKPIHKKRPIKNVKNNHKKV